MTLSHTQRQQTSRFGNPYLFLVVTVVAFSFAAVLVRQTQNAGMDSLTISAGRLLLTALILTPVVLSRYLDELRDMRRIAIAGAMLAGCFQSVQFMAMSISLEYTSVVVNQMIINTAPVWIALLEVTILKQRFSRPLYIGIAVAFVGGFIIAISSGSSTSGPNPELGNLIAFAGAIGASLYIFSGRVNRARISIIPYMWMVNLTGGTICLMVALITQQPILGYTTNAYLWLLVTTLVPQLIGHTSMNYVVGYLPATITSLANQLVVVTSGILAFLFFSELPTVLEILGIFIVISGVTMAIVAQARSRRKRKT
ncbi:EamA family transporter [Phototrophicus methaneseepsis]|uniref:EamA family transporter n=1 Tax=Phototrophicus methaneseepsis TaxID=2710758 RepID=A0A7S8E6X2_9CHLR|nr:DMT family transporter [Phototrophicus methaneseepsis]QPC81455.1 EamA family transporter [Phototrophicus methaneseepsis]